ncbi:hypothetical protein [Spirochaeta cellobiosiphila]|uniref:hypothetical protein n=1 Tax=Spirochaeta cellobiosiphila TaxID=504483 RepID=UPI000411DE1C|nr:hypothetical protein [Spirochaeta cellobiosiphila]
MANEENTTESEEETTKTIEVSDLEIVQGKTKVTTGITNEIIIKMSSYNESE